MNFTASKIMLDNIPIQIYQQEETELYDVLSKFNSNTTWYIQSNTSIEQFYSIDSIKTISKKIYQLHPFSIIKINTSSLNNIIPSTYLPSLLFPLPSQRNLNSPAIPCITWHIESNDILFLISHKCIKKRNGNITKLQQQNNISLLLNTRHITFKNYSFNSPLLCYIHPNDIYNALVLLQLQTNPHHNYTYTIVISDVIDTDFILKHQRKFSYNEIFVSYHFFQQNPQLKTILKNQTLTISSVHNIQHIICGMGTCRLCVEVQEKNNYEVCQKGIFQKIQ